MISSTDGPVAICPHHGEHSLHTGCFGCLERTRIMTPAPRLIALTSTAMGSGKSTVARYLERHGFVRIPFAGPLKAMATGLLEGVGIDKQETWERVYGDRKEEIIPHVGITSRKLQQLIGTEFARHLIRDSFWVDLAMSAARDMLDAGVSVVIDDMRFLNEYAAVRAAGGACYRVVRPGAQVTGGSHASEGALDHIDMPDIRNSGTVDDLHRSLDTVFGRPPLRA